MSMKKLFFKKQKAQKNSIRFYKYLFSYISMVLIVISIVGILTYRSSVKIVQEEVEKYNFSELSQIKSILDTRIREMDYLALKIASNPELSFSKLYNDGYDSYNAINELRKLKSSNFFIYDMLVLCSKNGREQRVYSLDATWDPEMLFATTYKFDKMTGDDFITLTQSAKYPFVLSKEVSGVFGNTDLIMYIYPFYHYPTSPVESIAFLIEAKEIKNIIGGILKNAAGSAAILDENSTPVFVMNNYGDMDTLKTIFQRSNSLSEAISTSTVKLDKQSYTVIKMQSEYNLWSYVRILPTSQFVEKSTSIKVMFTYTLVIVLVLGLLIAYYFSNMNYRPLKRFVEMTANSDIHHQEKVSRNRDEINVIYETFDSVIKENRSLTGKLKNKAGIEEEKLITLLLFGKELSSSEKKNLEEVLDTHFNREYFAVLAGCIDDYHTFTVEHPREMQNVIKFGILNVLDSLCKEADIGGYGLEILDEKGGCFALVVNIKDENDGKEKLKELSSKARQFIMENFGITITIGVGNIYDSCTSIHKSFFEARGAVEYRFLKGKNCTIFFNEMPCEKLTTPLNYEKDFIMAIQQGKQEALYKIMDRVFDDLSEKPHTPDAAKKMCESLVDALKKAIDALELELSLSLEAELENLLPERFETIGSFRRPFPA